MSISTYILSIFRKIDNSDPLVVYSSYRIILQRSSIMITSFYRAGTRSCLRRSMRSCLPTDIFARSLSTGQNNKKESRFDRFKHDIQDKIHDVEENISKKREELRDRAAHMKEEFERDANIMMAAAHIEMDAKKEKIKKKIEENADKLRQNAEDKIPPAVWALLSANSYSSAEEPARLA